MIEKGARGVEREATQHREDCPEALLIAALVASWKQAVEAGAQDFSGDLVLDSFGGSGTTGAVAHKGGRRWIMVELGEHCHTHIIPRLRKVIDGEDPGGITKSVNWKGGGGFRYYRLAPSLLEKDKWGNWVINKTYNAAMLAEALCKLEGFTYAPSDTVYWQHGHSTERDFIYVTTQTLSAEQLAQLSDEVGSERSLLVLCLAFRGQPDRYPNLTVKKIPKTAAIPNMTDRAICGSVIANAERRGKRWRGHYPLASC